MQDARWLAQLHRCGLIEGSMVPEQDIRDLRDLTRYRSKMVQAVTAEKKTAFTKSCRMPTSS
ncbi:transposase [Paenibacillus rhizoplanae]